MQGVLVYTDAQMCAQVCVGVYRYAKCVQVRTNDHRCAQVHAMCTGVYRFARRARCVLMYTDAQMCTGVCRRVQVCKVYKDAQMCASVHQCVQVCLGVCKCAQVCAGTQVSVQPFPIPL